MKINATDIAGLFVVESAATGDERGSFRRGFCAETFQARGIDFTIVQSSVSSNTSQGTLRGLHWQTMPHGETKLVRVVCGAVYDVVVDMRPEGSTYGLWRAFDLSAANGRGLCIPPGCAHGFLTLADDTVLTYAMSTPYVPDATRGVRWDDPGLAIAWPFPPTVVSRGDQAWADSAVVNATPSSALPPA